MFGATDSIGLAGFAVTAMPAWTSEVFAEVFKNRSGFAGIGIEELDYHLGAFDVAGFVAKDLVA